MFNVIIMYTYVGMTEVLKKNADDGNRAIAVPHEIISNNKENFAYERGHFTNYTVDGEILSTGE